MSIGPHAREPEERRIDGETVDRIIELACRAPSVHNSQPWQWRVLDNRVNLFADFTRQLVNTDPSRRDLMISCGAALHHFVVAASAQGWDTKVRRAPDPADERFVARLLLQPAAQPGADPAVLDDIRDRRTDRRRFASWPVPASRLQALAEAGRARGAVVVPVLDDMTRARVVRLTRRADELQRRRAAYLSELNASLTYWSDQGVPVGHVPVSDPAEETGFHLRFPQGVLTDSPQEEQPAADGVLLLCTSSDDAVSRVRAGEALSAIWLKATHENLLLVPYSQAVEVEQTRRELQDSVLDDTAAIQLVLRVGWSPSDRRPLPATPRRDLEEVRQQGIDPWDG